jgi:acyl carrier protein
MTRDEIKTKVLEILCEIAPETDPQTIKPEVNFRDQIDLDSMDYLNFVIALDERFHADIPEQDYTKFVSLNACVDELERLLPPERTEKHSFFIHSKVKQ